MGTTDSVWADLMRGAAPFGRRVRGRGTIASNRCRFRCSAQGVPRHTPPRPPRNDPVVRPAGALPADAAERRESLLARKVPSIFFGHVNTPAEDPCFKNT